MNRKGNEMSYLPEGMMTHEDDQILTRLMEQTMSDKGLESPTAIVADILDPINAQADDLYGLSRKELKVLLMYAKLGRNVFLRHLESNSKLEED